MRTEIPVRQDDSQAAILNLKVDALTRIRQVSVQLQRFKLGMMKTARGTNALQHVIASIKPVQDGIFELLSLDRGIIGTPSRKC
jgi:hypothetical protein